MLEQAVDSRNPSQARERAPRVTFGNRWVEKSVLELYKEDIARFRALVGTDLDEDPLAELAAGRVPALKALRLHNGTIYRWNRACYGVTNVKPHLRIENRVLPSRPSTLDEVANTTPRRAGRAPERSHHGHHRGAGLRHAGRRLGTGAAR